MGGKVTNKTSSDSDQDYDGGTQGDGYAVTQDLFCFYVQKDPHSCTPSYLTI